MRLATALVLLFALLINGVLAFLTFRNSDHVTSETVPLLLAGGGITALCAYLVAELEEDSTAFIMLFFGGIVELVVIRTLLKRKRSAT